MTPKNQLRALVEAARKNGWSTGIASINQLRYQARWQSLEPITSRRSREDVEVLRPVEHEQAPKRSLSATYGLGAQPLHTDGAHQTEPPDIVILAARQPSPVPTMLWRHDWTTAGSIREDLTHRLFTVDDGRTRFLAPAYSRGRIRFDPGCMSPADSRARRVVEHFRNALDSATAFEWTDPDQVLVINNRIVLHARADAEPDTDRELQRLMFRIQKGEDS